MRKFIKFSSLVTVVLVIVASLSITSFAAKSAPVAQVEAVDSTQVIEVVNRTGSADEAKFILFVGKEFAGRHFTLETDAGMAPHAYTVNNDGYIEFYFETGSSSKFELSLLDNHEPTTKTEKVEVVEDEKAETTEKIKDVDASDDSEEKSDEKEEGLGMKFAILVAFLALLVGVYIFMCKKNGYPIGFKKKRVVNSHNSDEF